MNIKLFLCFMEHNNNALTNELQNILQRDKKFIGYIHYSDVHGLFMFACLFLNEMSYSQSSREQSLRGCLVTRGLIALSNETAKKTTIRPPRRSTRTLRHTFAYFYVP